MKKVLALLLAVAMVLPLLTGCGTQAPAQPPSNQEPAPNGDDTTKETTFGLTPMEKRSTLRVGFFSGSAHGMPFYIADKMGFFDELNIDVVYESFIAGPAMMEANASWDICDVGGPGVLNGMKNYDMQMIGVCDNEYNTAMFVRPGSELANDPTNPELWKGKKIILTTGTTLQYMAASYLKSIGTSIEDVTVIGMDVTSGLTAFMAGEADAVCAWNAVAYNAEDQGLIRVTDIGKMDLNNVCGLCATPDAIENKLELITTAWMVYYMTWEWCQENDANMDKAVELYVTSCEDEGVKSDESICRRALEVFMCPSVKDAYTIMTATETDRSGSGEVLKAANLLFETLDFFISLGNYNTADRQKINEMKLVAPIVAENAANTLKTLNYIQ